MIRADRKRHRKAAISCGSLAALILFAACGPKADPQHVAPGATASVAVGYVVVQPTHVTLTKELSGRAGAYESSDVLPQATGIIQKRLFVEGALVKRGQPLYQIDPSLYRAAVNQAEANLLSAEANLLAAEALAVRYGPLVEIEAVSQQTYDTAVAGAGMARAAVAQARAELNTAQINLKFTTVPAPISGRIGRSLFTVGQLATIGQANPLTTIQQLDQMFVDIEQSSAELLALRRSLASGGEEPASASVRLTLEDGSIYNQVGTIQFAESLVDPTTGTVNLRARFPNPEGILLPGMFVRASFAQAVDTEAFLVPQAAVSRSPTGQATVYVVGPDNKAVQRTVVTGQAQGQFWVVAEGLSAGDKVITQGLSNVQPNTPLRPVPASTPQVIAPPPGKGVPSKTGGK